MAPHDSVNLLAVVMTVFFVDGTRHKDRMKHGTRTPLFFADRETELGDAPPSILIHHFRLYRVKVNQRVLKRHGILLNKEKTQRVSS
jgi:hypothetical protein